MSTVNKSAGEGILSSIGNTPLIRLAKIFKNSPFRVYAKLETFNPGGSIKDRTALSIITNAMKAGDLQPGNYVIESSSGNMGIGLAQICSYFGLPFICVVDPKTTAQNIKILHAYGAEVDMVSEPDPATGEFLPARVNRVKALLSETPSSFWPNQYANLYNPLAHHSTMREIAEALGGKIDYLFCATSTCGTLRGCADYVRQNNLHTKVWAVDAEGSAIFGSAPAKRLIPGHGAAILPELFQPGLADRCIHVTDVDCIVGCRTLLQQEALLAGGSSGAVISALLMVKDEIDADANCVVIIPDRGTRYLETIYSDDWVEKHFGDVLRQPKGHALQEVQYA